jgi:hypothetical protein
VRKVPGLEEQGQEYDHNFTIVAETDFYRVTILRHCPGNFVGIGTGPYASYHQEPFS